jgi:molybdate transport system substrate-binding protein
MVKKCLTTIAAIMAPLLACLAGVPAHSAEFKVMSANVFTGVLEEPLAAFEAVSGHKGHVVYATAGAGRKRIEEGETADAVILPRPMLDGLARQGRIVPEGIRDLAHSAVGVVVRKGERAPRLDTIDDLRRALTEAKSVSYADPSRGGATGVLVLRILDQLGLAEQVRAKTKLPPPGQFAVELVARGEADLALAQPMEARAHPEVEVAGLLPAELQDQPGFTFSAGIAARAAQREAARAFIDFLAGPQGAAVFKARGMDPG